VSFGAMMALISTGARIASERTDGWTRQLRITPLSTGAYLRAKVLTGYAMAALTIATLYAAGALVGVRLPLERWLGMTGVILVGLLPFAALGVLLGHLLTAPIRSDLLQDVRSAAFPSLPARRQAGDRRAAPPADMAADTHGGGAARGAPCGAAVNAVARRARANAGP
jgi:hypothetical protein